MTKKKQKKKYPMLAVRMKRQELAYIRRQSDERKLSVAEYVRMMLVPFNLSV